MNDEAWPEPDRSGDAPHPRETAALFGQARAEAEFLEAFNSDRLHHGWLISGPKGIGKATLAWKIARFLLSQPVDAGADMFGDPVKPTDLSTPEDHGVMRRTRALAEPQLFLLRRGWDDKGKTLKTKITVDEARKLKSFFQLSAPDGGRRVVIVDAADEMNVAAANAILKVLEEPPARTYLLLVTHQRSRLLPTIRSRCRDLRCDPLGAADLEQAVVQAGGEAEAARANTALAGGSVGMALRLSEMGGADHYKSLVNLAGSMPRLDREGAIALADRVKGKGGDELFTLYLELFDQMLARLARSGVAALDQDAAGGAEAEVFARLCPDAHAAQVWAALHHEMGERARRGRAVNLDASSLILDMILKMNDTASGLAK